MTDSTPYIFQVLGGILLGLSAFIAVLEIRKGILKLHSSIIKNQIKIMADLSKLQAAVASETTLDQSVITLLTNLAAEIKAAGTDQAALDAITTQMEQNAAALSQAVQDNTPAQG